MKPRIALVSVGLGRVQRGFERFFTDLAAVLRPETDVLLFGSRKFPEVARVPQLLRPATAVVGALPVGRLLGKESYQRDCVAYGLMLMPDLLRGGFDVVHVIDPPLALVLSRLRRVFRLRSRLLFTDGCLVPRRYFGYADHIHFVSQARFEECVTAGVPERGATHVPVGVPPERVISRECRSAVRRKYGISGSCFVILAVSAVKRTHKRVDYLIDEVAQLPGEVLLWIDGNLEDSSIAQLASARLGARCRITCVPSSVIPELFAAADVLAHGALEEAFGLAVVEALSNGLPVLVHDSPHFHWLTGDRDYLVDMSVGGNLAARLSQVRRSIDVWSSKAQANAAAVRRRFDWKALAPEYVQMYRRAAAIL